MTVNLADWDVHFRRLLLASAILLGVLDWWADGANAWFRSGFVIAIAGCVGYFTNFLAIKMLFQPRRGAVLGWRGLIPKNQAQIAASLGQSVQNQLLAPDIVLAYISERRLIERGSEALVEWIDARLQQPEVRRRITTTLIGVLNERGADLLKAGVPAGPVNSVPQVLQHPHTLHRDMVVEPGSGQRALGIPVKLSRTPGSVRAPAPALGQHSVEVLQELGYSADEIEALVRDGVATAARPGH